MNVELTQRMAAPPVQAANAADSDSALPSDEPATPDPIDAPAIAIAAPSPAILFAAPVTVSTPASASQGRAVGRAGESDRRRFGFCRTRIGKRPR